MGMNCVMNIEINNLNWGDLPEKEIAKGLFAKIVHTDNMTLVRWRFVKNSELPKHSHPHEQVTLVLDGKILLTVKNKELNLQNGDVLPIKSNVPHSGKAITNCDVIDVFTPVREDLKY